MSQNSGGGPAKSKSMVAKSPTKNMADSLSDNLLRECEKLSDDLLQELIQNLQKLQVSRVNTIPTSRLPLRPLDPVKGFLYAYRFPLVVEVNTSAAAAVEYYIVKFGKSNPGKLHNRLKNTSPGECFQLKQPDVATRLSENFQIKMGTSNQSWMDNSRSPDDDNSNMLFIIQDDTSREMELAFKCCGKNRNIGSAKLHIKVPSDLDKYDIDDYFSNMKVKAKYWRKWIKGKDTTFGWGESEFFLMTKTRFLDLKRIFCRTGDIGIKQILCDKPIYDDELVINDCSIKLRDTSDDEGTLNLHKIPDGL